VVKKILVGYDDTEPAKRALERAAELAKAFAAEVVVTSVTPLAVSIGRSAGPIDVTDPPAKHAEELAHARAYLDGQGIKAEYRGAIGDVAEAIVDAAHELGADLIVVGTRDSGWLGRMLHHSVSTAVSHRAHCDVLIVH
jgi:nucleotide-binding universal stress UspA family protein